jgi:hypothetical protein
MLRDLYTKSQVISKRYHMVYMDNMRQQNADFWV